MRVVVDKRKPTTSQTLRLWVNTIATFIAGVPMLVPDLKQYLPSDHFYGVTASLGLLFNAAIDMYQRTRYGRILAVEDLDEETSAVLKSAGKL